MSLAARAACILCVTLTGCSSDAPADHAAGQRDGGAEGGAVDSGPSACLLDAFTVTGATTFDSGTCPAGLWKNTGTACGPPGSVPECRPAGDGLCYRLCATIDDCPDPCAPACRGMDFYAGSDIPAGAAPVCQPGELEHFPASCESAVRACWGACRTGSLDPHCAIDCWKTAKECAYQACQPIYIACAQDCAVTQTGDPALIACYNACSTAEWKCQGPH